MHTILRNHKLVIWLKPKYVGKKHGSKISKADGAQMKDHGLDVTGNGRSEQEDK